MIMKKLALIVGTPVLLLVMIGSCSSSGDSDTPEPAAVASSEAPKPSADLFKEETSRVSDVATTVSAKSVAIKFTTDGGRDSAQRETMNLLEGMQKHYPGKAAELTATSTLMDQAGNESVRQVLRLDYSAAAIKGINFENAGLVRPNVWELATEAYQIHPVLIKS